MTAVAFRDLVVRLGGRDALAGITAEVEPGEFVAVCGPNGAGKTTLLRASLGLVQAAAGSVMLDGADVRRLEPEHRADRAAYLPQERRIAWGLPALRIAALGAVNAGPSEAEARGRIALAEVGLSGLEERGAFEMSGGERARVLLARLFATAAPILFLDEPVAGLDPDAQLLVLDLLGARKEAGITVVATLHDLSLAARYADRVLVLDRGRLVANGSPTAALSPAVLDSAFGLSAEWIETLYGPLLSGTRRSTAPADPRPGRSSRRGAGRKRG